ncbi:hypothetical protein AMJ39_04710 [candidate division TA06 bacterium DG_24]|uniref:HhH-GPD domain-containing protein n=3 Tax=Bacteria division TA06 TaxID=1156500 RepID=A0A0S8JAL0_UNCT6|nr:MAG: hypothetical protein AMJ39_04710 [candidate division TA06 bacterium DG_24]KPK71529.1 MAG: hypothetical protein AMJ82_00785 [candidate division TA06 bacterium SM23_40]KPL06772.1 MAG: hypothetical protein AMJ71_09350 [candidate division TA06 bacterium SM1_40]
MSESGFAVRVVDALEGAYGRRRWRSRGDPVGVLIGTILSQNTSDVNSGRAYDELRKTFSSWDDVRRARVATIARAIRSGGLADIKAPRIKSILGAIYRERGEVGLDFLRDLSDEEALEYLTKFPGVGLKTAACVLLFALGRHVIPVDTHVFRVSRRLGMIDGNVSRDEAYCLLRQIVPRERAFAFHVLLVDHGRTVCLAREPRCEQCVLSSVCPRNL